MRSNVRSCSEWRLYVIVDRGACGARPVEEVAAAALHGGADVLQLRDKSATAVELKAAAERVLALTRPAGIPLIVNDRGEVAAAVGSDGVHVGQEDDPVSTVRQQLAGRGLIGKSTHGLTQAVAAQAEGVDYIGYGPIFPTPTKPTYERVGVSLIDQVVGSVRVPVVCIGGIDETNLPRVLGAGAACVAVVRAVCTAEDPEAATRRLKRIVEEHGQRIARPRELRSGYNG